MGVHMYGFLGTKCTQVEKIEVPIMQYASSDHPDECEWVVTSEKYPVEDFTPLEDDCLWMARQVRLPVDNKSVQWIQQHLAVKGVPKTVRQTVKWLEGCNSITFGCMD